MNLPCAAPVSHAIGAWELASFSERAHRPSEWLHGMAADAPEMPPEPHGMPQEEGEEPWRGLPGFLAQMKCTTGFGHRLCNLVQEILHFFAT